MPEFLFSNFGQSALSAPLVYGAESLVVSPSDASRFPVPGPDQVFTLILMDGRNEPEIVWVTSNPLSGVLAVERGREGTPAQNWEVGTSALHSHTAASLEWFVTGGQILWKNQFQSMIDALNARIDALEQDQADTDGNQFTQINYLESRIEQSFATISENWQVVTDFNYAMSSITQTLTADVASNHAELTTFKQATAGSFGAQALLNIDLEARTNNALATAGLALQASVDNDSAISTLTGTVTANWNANAASINNLQTADVNNYSALSSAIQTVSANYGPLSATVTQKAIALADLTGQVSGAWMVDITAGDQFAGFRIVAGVNAGQVVNYAKFNVAKFIIDSPGGSVNPFSYDAINGWLTVQNVRILGNLVVEGTINQNRAVRNSFTNGMQYLFNPGTVLNDGPVQPVASFVYVSTGGRVRVNWQLLVVNADPTLDADVRFEIYVNGAFQWFHADKLGTDYGFTLVFSQTIYNLPGSTLTVEIKGQTYTGAGGTLNATVSQVWADIDDFGTET